MPVSLGCAQCDALLAAQETLSTPLMAAAYRNNLPCIEALVQAGADTAAKNKVCGSAGQSSAIG